MFLFQSVKFVAEVLVFPLTTAEPILFYAQAV